MIENSPNRLTFGQESQACPTSEMESPTRRAKPTTSSGQTLRIAAVDLRTGPNFDEQVQPTVTVGLFREPHIALSEMLPFGREGGGFGVCRPRPKLGRDLPVLV